MSVEILILIVKAMTKDYNIGNIIANGLIIKTTQLGRNGIVNCF